MAEREWVRGLRERFPAAGDEVVGLGDDAAVLPHRGLDTVVCCDPVVQGVHFAADAPPSLIGRKAVNRNLADLAAMGATADWLLVSLVLPTGLAAAGGAAGRRKQRALLDGIGAAARAAHCTVVGGDVAVHDGPLVVTVTALGHCVGRPLCRDGARVGDTIHVTGALGGSLRGGHLRFDPPLAQGAALGRFARVGACMDVSDGLLLDLATLLVASSEAVGADLGADLDASAVPITSAARAAARASGRSALEHALNDGEDHVLLFTVRPGRGRLPKALGAVAQRAIGRVVFGAGITLVADDGQRTEGTGRGGGGFEHAL